MKYEIEVCCPDCLEPLLEGYTCAFCSYTPQPPCKVWLPYQVAGHLMEGERVVVVIPGNDVPQDVKRLRNLLRRCQVFAGDFGVGRERIQLIEDLKDELAKG